MGRMLMYPDAGDDQGNDLQVGQFPQISMQPHADQMRMWGVVVRGGDWVAGGFVGDCAGQSVVG